MTGKKKTYEALLCTLRLVPAGRFDADTLLDARNGIPVARVAELLAMSAPPVSGCLVGWHLWFNRRRVRAAVSRNKLAMSAVLMEAFHALTGLKDEVREFAVISRWPEGDYVAWHDCVNRDYSSRLEWLESKETLERSIVAGILRREIEK